MLVVVSLPSSRRACACACVGGCCTYACSVPACPQGEEAAYGVPPDPGQVVQHAGGTPSPPPHPCAAARHFSHGLCLPCVLGFSCCLLALGCCGPSPSFHASFVLCCFGVWPALVPRWCSLHCCVFCSPTPHAAACVPCAPCVRWRTTHASSPSANPTSSR